MSNHHDNHNEKLIGVLAEFDDADALLAGAREIHAAGYQKLDAYSPFPIHGIDEAIGIKRSILPFICLFVGIGACGFGVFLQWYVNAFVDSPIFPGYDYYISGKPLWSLPANIPVIFEIVVLASAFAAFFGMLILNKLPQLANPLHRIARFRRATNDRFFLTIDVDDEKFDMEGTSNDLMNAGATEIEPIRIDQTDHKLPAFVRTIGILLSVLLLVPPVLVFRAQGMTNRDPRLHVNPDMDFQTKFKPQTVGPNLMAGVDRADPRYVWSDVRSARLPIDGTIARNQLEDDWEFFHGIKSPVNDDSANHDAARFFGGGVSISTQSISNTSLVSAQQFLSQETEGEAAQDVESTAPESEAQDVEPQEGGTEDLPPEPDWVTEFPERLAINASTLIRGRKMYEINCVACHGYAGDGDGLVNKRALELATINRNGLPGAEWTEAQSFHHPDLVAQPAGRVFDTITNGRATMGPYGSRIKPADRWAIVLYIKALQETRINSTEKFVVPESTPTTPVEEESDSDVPATDDPEPDDAAEADGAANAPPEKSDDPDQDREPEQAESGNGGQSNPAAVEFNRVKDD